MQDPSLTGKTTTDAATQVVVETVTYSYNFAGQLSQVVTEKYEAGEVVRREPATFGYDDNGMRTKARYETEVDADSDPGTPVTVQSETETTYLDDPSNPTGYSQIIRETVRDVATGQITTEVVTTVALDVIAQTAFTPDGPAEGETRILGYDEHGSTRLLTDAVRQVLQVYAYDAYGIAVGFDPEIALTNLLYSGEQYDQQIGMEYLRARFYDVRNGRFPTSDPFKGHYKYPLSLHKYLYVHADPINGVDSRGLFEGSIFGLSVSFSWQSVARGMTQGAVFGVLTGAAVGGVDGYLKKNDWEDAIDGAIYGAISGGIIGALTGGIGSAFAATFKALSLTAKLRFLKVLFATNVVGTTLGVGMADSWQQGLFRGSVGLIGMVAEVLAMRQLILARKEAILEYLRLGADAA